MAAYGENILSIKRSGILRPIALLVLAVFLCNTFAYGLAPTSSFNPIVQLNTRDESGKITYEITEDSTEKGKMIDTFPEDPAFMYLSLVIGQFLEDLRAVSKVGMSEEGRQERFSSFKESIARDLAHIDMSRFLYREMRLKNDTVSMPYERKDGKEKQILKFYLPDEKYEKEPDKKLEQKQFPEMVYIPIGSGVRVILEDPPKIDPLYQNNTVAGLFAYLVNKNITTPKKGLTGREIARRLDKPYDNVVLYLLRYLRGLRLLAWTPRYQRITPTDKIYIPPEIAAQKEDILGILSRFSSKWRPTKGELDTVYRKELQKVPNVRDAMNEAERVIGEDVTMGFDPALIDVFEAYKGNPVKTPSRGITAKINRSSKGTAKCTLVDRRPGGRKIELYIPKESLEYHRQRKERVIGRKAVIRVEQDINHGQIIVVYREADFKIQKGRARPLVVYRYFPNLKRAYRAPGKEKKPVTGICRPVNLALLDIFAYKRRGDEIQPVKGRTATLPVGYNSPTESYFADLWQGDEQERFRFPLRGEATRIFANKQEKRTVSAKLKKHPDYGIFLELSHDENILVRYYHFSDLKGRNKFSEVDFDKLAFIDYILGNKNIHGKAVTPKVYYPETGVKKSGRIDIEYKGRRAGIGYLKAMAGEMVVFVPVKDNEYGYSIHVHERDLYLLDKKRSPDEIMVKRPYGKKFVPIDTVPYLELQRLVRYGYTQRPFQLIQMLLESGVDQQALRRIDNLNREIVKRSDKIAKKVKNPDTIPDPEKFDFYLTLVADELAAGEKVYQKKALSYFRSLTWRDDSTEELCRKLRQRFKRTPASIDQFYQNVAIIHVLSKLPHAYAVRELAGALASLEGKLEPELRESISGPIGDAAQSLGAKSATIAACIDHEKEDDRQVCVNMAALHLLSALEGKDSVTTARKVVQFLDYRGRYDGYLQALMLDYFRSIPDSLLFQSGARLQKVRSEPRDEEKERITDEQLLLRGIAEYSLLTVLGEIALGARAQLDDEEARVILRDASLRLVVSIAKKYVENPTFKLVELYNEGWFGLDRASRKYKPQMGFKFGTYATYWIRQRISRYKDNTRELVRIPVNIQKEVDDFRAICNEAGIDPMKQRRFETITEKTGIAVDDVKRLIRHLRRRTHISLNNRVRQGNGGEDGDLDWADSLVSDIEEAGGSTGDREVANWILDEVTEVAHRFIDSKWGSNPIEWRRNRLIWEVRILPGFLQRMEMEDSWDERIDHELIAGLDLTMGALPLTLEGTAKIMGKITGAQAVTRERVRQIESQILTPVKKKLQEFRNLYIRRFFPHGSIPGVFAFLCDNNITNREEAMTGEEIARAVGLSYTNTISIDLRNLLRLNLVKRLGKGRVSKRTRYYVPRSLRRSKARILEVLKQFRKKDLRPGREKLPKVFENELMKIDTVALYRAQELAGEGFIAWPLKIVKEVRERNPRHITAQRLYDSLKDRLYHLPKQQGGRVKVYDKDSIDVHVRMLADSIIGEQGALQQVAMDYFGVLVEAMPGVAEKIIIDLTERLDFNNDSPDQLVLNIAVPYIAANLTGVYRTDEWLRYFSAWISPFLDYTGVAAETVRETGLAFFRSIPNKLLFVEGKPKRVPENHAFDEERDEPLSAFEQYAREIGQYARLTRLGEWVFGVRAQCGDKSALDHLITANLRLVISIAKRYASKRVPIMDLVGPGNAGLMRAAKKFEAQRGYTFGTYATYWIRQFIKLHIARMSAAVPLSYYERERVVWFYNACQAHNLDPRKDTEERVAAALELDIEEIRAIRRSMYAMISIDRVWEGGTHERDNTWAEMLEDHDEEAFLDRYDLLEAVERKIEERLRRRWKRSDKWQRNFEIWRLHVYPIIAGAILRIPVEEPLVLDELQDLYSITRARAGQIAATAWQEAQKVVAPYLEEDGISFDDLPKRARTDNRSGRTGYRTGRARGRRSSRSLGSIPNVFKILCDHEITNPDKALSAEELGILIGLDSENLAVLSYEGIRHDITALFYHLDLIEKEDRRRRGKQAWYYVPPHIWEKRNELLAVLDAEFGRHPDLRPDVWTLHEIKTGKLDPILQPPEDSGISQPLSRNMTVRLYRVVADIRNLYHDHMSDLNGLLWALPAEIENNKELSEINGYFLEDVETNCLFITELLKKLHDKVLSATRIENLSFQKLVAEFRTMADSAWALYVYMEKNDEYIEKSPLILSFKESLKEFNESLRELIDFVDGPLERKPVDINDIVQGAARKARIEVPYVDADIVFDLSDDERIRSFVTYHGTLIGYMVRNLVKNALLHGIQNSPKGEGTVTATTGINGNALVIRVADDGIGLPPRAYGAIDGSGKQRIFSTDYTTSDKDAEPWHGLGTALCWDVVEVLGGTIRLDSELGTGATFTIRLPLPMDSEVTEEKKRTFKNVLDELPRQTGLRGLDIGTGIMGKFCRNLENMYPGRFEELVGIDEIDDGKRVFPRDGTRTTLIGDMPYERFVRDKEYWGYFDVVFLNAPEASVFPGCMKTIKKLLRPEGIIVIAPYKSRQLRTRLRDDLTTEWREEDVHVSVVMERYNPWITEQGFTMEGLTTLEHYPMAEYEKAPVLIIARPNVLVREREETIARQFIDSQLWRARQAMKRDESIIIGWNDAWIPTQQRAPVQKLLSYLYDFSRREGLDNLIIVRGKGDELKAAIHAERERQRDQFKREIPLENILVIGDEDTVEDAVFDEWKSTSDEARAFFVAIDPTRLNKADGYYYLPVLEMLFASVNRAFDPTFAIESPFFECVEAGTRVVRFIPLPTIDPLDLQMLKDLYDKQIEIMQFA